MKRSLRLQPLSREHHTALSLARRAEKAAAAARVEEIRDMAARAVAGFDGHLKRHFEEEERWLLPALGAAGEQALVERTLADHAALRALLARLGAAPDADALGDFARLLQDHVRFEERELFPAFERLGAVAGP